MNKLQSASRVATSSIGALLGVLLVAVILRLLFFVGMARTDDYGYAQAAYNLASGVYHVSGFNLHHQTRLAIVVPVAASFRLFGVNEYSAELWPLLCSLGSIAATFYLGKLIFDQRTGLIAAVLLSFFPLDVVYSTQLLPDVIQPFFLAVSVLCFLKGHDARETRASSIWFSLSWLSVGVAFFARESGLVILLFLFAYILYTRRVRKEYLAAGALVAGLSLVIGLIYLRLQGNPLAGLQYVSEVIHFGTAEYLHAVPRHFLKTWLEYPRMLTRDPQFLYFSIVTAVAFVYLVRTREKHLYVPGLWLVTIFLYLEVLSSLHYMRRLDRYLTMLTIPALLIVARFLAVFAAQLGRAMDLPDIGGFVGRIRQQLGGTRRRRMALWPRAIFWAVYAMAVSLLLAGILISPAFVRDHLSPDGILEANTIRMIQETRYVASGTATFLTATLLVSRKWGWLHTFSVAGEQLLRISCVFGGQLRKFGYRRLVGAFVIGFLFATSVTHIAVDARAWRNHTLRYRDVGNSLASLPKKDIYLPDGWHRRINFYLGFDTGYDIYRTPQENSGSILKTLPDTGLEQIEDSYVVASQWVLEDGEWVVREEIAVPDWWDELTRFTHHRGETVIYYAGFDALRP